MQNKVILIGAIREGQKPVCGETMKNQLLLQRFKEIFDNVKTIDTYKWRTHPWCIFKTLWYLLYYQSANVVISASQSSRYLLRFLYYFPIHKRVFYWVIGGTLPVSVKRGKVRVCELNNLIHVIVQSKSMVVKLLELGVNNAVYVPNSKPIVFRPDFNKNPIKNNYKFIFLSRIHPDKGIAEIINAVDIICNSGCGNMFQVDFYGPIEKQYEKQFFELITDRKNVAYHGYLDLLTPEGYSIMASYDAMLFPTYWDNEGFPGAIIDAYIAGLPIIASDWNLNREFVEEGTTGFIIPVHDAEALAQKMLSVIRNEVDLNGMRRCCYEYVQQFETRKVLSAQLFTKLGMIS